MKLRPGQVCFDGMPNIKEGAFHRLMKNVVVGHVLV
ncbi:unnamed protein product [Acanthoscelides obtectus]|uniref:Uncharacterized protein n=1 Tax=Acanthoscelides obtectus TaxID=200917 RepID=A0A9P0L4X8_ACAOB|nr:unnamed protein product [Acanthoscelides obtectus]CAK1649698.1 hypothetical protein AOBTE_LOCUS16362 [Acanthoscelides obtectus]